MCNICNFETNNKFNYEKHKISLKHKKNISIEYGCIYCNKKYKSNQNLNIHLYKNHLDELKNINYDLNNKYDNKIKSILLEAENKKLKIENEKEKEKIKMENEIEKEKIKIENEIEKEKIKIENEKIKMENEIVDKENKLLKLIIDNSTKTIDNSTKTTEMALKISYKSISALNYAKKYYKDAPMLTPLDNYNIIDYHLDNDVNKQKFSNELLYHYKESSLPIFIGDYIVKIYKKEDITQQSLHTTDSSRMNYIIKKTGWESDKGGIFISTNIIEKIIQKCTNIIKWYNKFILLKITDVMHITENIQSIIININLLLNYIETGLLLKDVNKYIAPYFNLNKQLLDNKI
jgi:hypothetical protein